MAINIGTQIFLVLIFAFMTAMCKKFNLELGVKIFGWGTAILFVAFAIMDILDAINLIN